MTIDSASDADREWCARLMASTDPWITLGRSYEHCLARCRQPEFVVQVIRNSEQPRGFVLIHPTGLAGSPYIATIAIARESRGQGLGVALLDYAEQYFPEARHIFLCVSSFNVAARRLYERRGYSQVGELKDYVIAGASEILMHKRLRVT
jgi:ribosomal-protein-alanine N-acetyltransferase